MTEAHTGQFTILCHSMVIVFLRFFMVFLSSLENTTIVIQA